MYTSKSVKTIELSPFVEDSLNKEQCLLVGRAIDDICRGWVGTPYMPGQQCLGVAVDCVRFVSAVLDEILGERVETHRLPQDMSFHNPAGAKSAMKQFLSRAPHFKVEPPLQPGDVIVMGPTGGGPGHAAIVGLDAIWHCGPTGVVNAGKGICSFGVYNYKTAYRASDRSSWFDRLTGAGNGK